MKSLVLILSLISTTHCVAQSNEFAFLLANTKNRYEEITIRFNKNQSFNFIELDKFTSNDIEFKMVINENITITEKHFLNKQKLNLYIDIIQLKCIYSSNVDIWIRISKNG